MVMIDYPLAILPNINEGVSAFNLITSRSHFELTHPYVLAPVEADGNMVFQDSTLRSLDMASRECIQVKKRDSQMSIVHVAINTLKSICAGYQQQQQSSST